MDDDAGILHRLSVGGGGGRQNRGIHLPGAEFLRVVPGCGETGFPAACGNRTSAYTVGDNGELSRDTVKRDVSELVDLRDARAFCGVRGGWRNARVGSKFSSLVYIQSIHLNFARATNCSVLYDRLRIGDQVGGRSESRVSREGILARDLCGDYCRVRLLCDRDCCGGIRCAMATTHRGSVYDGGGL